MHTVTCQCLDILGIHDVHQPMIWRTARCADRMGIYVVAYTFLRYVHDHAGIHDVMTTSVNKKDVQSNLNKPKNTHDLEHTNALSPRWGGSVLCSKTRCSSSCTGTSNLRMTILHPAAYRRSCLLLVQAQCSYDPEFETACFPVCSRQTHWLSTMPTLSACDLTPLRLPTRVPRETNRQLFATACKP